MTKVGRNTDQSSDAIKRISSRRVDPNDRTKIILDADIRTRLLAMRTILSSFPNRGAIPNLQN